MLTATRFGLRNWRDASGDSHRCEGVEVSGRCALLLFIAAAGLALAGMAHADVAACKMIQIADLPVRMVRNHLVVDAAIDGKKIGAMVDTGAALTLILRPATAWLGLERRETRGYQLFGVGGPTKVESALIDEFKIGNASRKNWRMFVAGEREFGDDIAVILGEDFFAQIDVEFDLAHNVVRLFKPIDCEGVSLAYWTADEPREAVIEAIYDSQPQILLTVQVNGQPVKAMLDSGASTSILTMADAARAGITPQATGVVAIPSGSGMGTKTVDTWVGPFDTVIIGSEIIRHTHIRFGDLYKDMTYISIGSRLMKSVEQDQPMLIGADFLRSHRVLVSHSQRKMYFSYLGGPVFGPPPPPQSGAEPRTDKDTPTKSGEK